MLYNRIYTLEVVIPQVDITHDEVELTADESATVTTKEVQSDVYLLTESHIDFDARIVYNFGGAALPDETLKLTIKGLGNNSGLRPITKDSVIRIYAGYGSSNNGKPSLLYEGTVVSLFNISTKHTGHVLTVNLIPNATIIKRARVAVTFSEGTPFGEALTYFETSLGKPIIATEAFKNTLFPETITYFGGAYKWFVDFVKSYHHTVTSVNGVYQVTPVVAAPKGYSPHIVYDLEPHTVLDDISFATEDANSTPTVSKAPEYLNIKLVLMPISPDTIIRLDPLKFGKDYGGDFFPETVAYNLDSTGDTWFTELKLRRHAEGEIIFK